MKSRIKFDKSLIIVIAIALIVGALVFFIFRNIKTDQITELVENEKDINAVFLVHEGDRLLFTEVFFYNSATGKGALLDIPGETGVIIEKLGKIDRIDRLYDPGSPEEYISGIEKMIEQEIPYYFQFSLDNLSSLVDIMGGLEMFIANPVEILTDEQTVLLPSGSIILDGEKTKTFVTYDDPEETDVDESGRREKTVQAILKAFKQQGSLLVSDRMFPFLIKTVKTNADRDSVRAFVVEMGRLDISRIVFQRVLGVRRTVDDQELLFSHYDGNLLRETVKQTITALANIEVVSDEELNVTIEILNGTSINGLASRTSQVFQSFGYEVAHIGNYSSSDIQKTKVIDRMGDIAQAQRVASIIKCSNVETAVQDAEAPETVSDEAPEEYDLVIILGKDFDGRYCKE